MAELEVSWLLLPVGLALLSAMFVTLKSVFSQRDNSAKTRRARTTLDPIEQKSKFPRMFRKNKKNGSSDIFR